MLFIKKITILMTRYKLCTYFHLLSSYTHSMTMVVECTHSTIKLLNVHIQWLLAIEFVHSMAKPMTNPLNVYIQWLSTINTT